MILYIIALCVFHLCVSVNQMIPYISVPISYPNSAPIEITIQNAPTVPFYSQFKDIRALSWQKNSCGVASLAMLIEYYKPGIVSVNKLLTQAIDSGAYRQDVGWKHRELALLSKKYGLEGKNYDLSSSDKKIAFAQFKDFLEDGPVIASVYNKFDPKSTVPHLVVINGIKGDTIYYNDPAAKNGGKEISTADFLKGWKKRFIVVRPVKESGKIILSKK